jgi:hypothetical protein
VGQIPSDLSPLRPAVLSLAKIIPD